MRSHKPSFLTKPLCKWSSQATVIGKSVLPVLLLVRLVILGAAVQTAWTDDDAFSCNTNVPGCNAVCYDELTPFAAPRLWTLQLLLVLSPGLVFLCYLLHLTHQEKQTGKRDGEVKGRVLGMYRACVVAVIQIEVVFVVIQSILYNFWVRVDFKCKRRPCPFQVDCFIPRAGQKSSFLVIMFVASCVSLLLSAVELICVLVRKKQHHETDALQSGSEVAESPCFLEQLLSLWHGHAGLLGKTLLPVLQLIRVVIVGAAVQPVWDKEFRGFVCNTQQPGCSHAVFNHIFPFSLHQYWTLQVVLVLVPGLIFFCYLVHVIIQGKKCDQGAQVKGHVLRAYLGVLSAGVLLEVGFAVSQALTYGFRLSAMYDVGIEPCPHRVDCYMPQSTEKSLFMVITFTVTCLSGLLTLTEMCVVLNRERPWKKQQNNKMSGFQMDLQEEGAATEIKDSCSNLNI